MLHDLRRATAHYQEALAHAPDHLPSIRGARRVLIARKSYQSALQLFDAEARVTRDPRRKAAVHYAKGRLLEDVIGNREDALRAYMVALELSRGDPSILKALEQRQVDSQAWEALDRTYERQANTVAGDPRHRAALVVQRARLVESHRDEVEAAIELYETALRLDPRAPGALPALKRLHHSRKRWRDLIRVLELEADQTTDPRVRTMALYRIGRLHAERLGNRSEALAALERAAKDAPQEPLILDELIRLYEVAERYDAMVDALARLVDTTREPEEKIGLLHRIGQVWEEKLKDEPEAIHYYESALRVRATFVPAVQALDRLYERREEWEALIKVHLAEAEASSDPSRRAASHARIASILEAHLGRNDDAAEHHGRALALVPGYRPSFQALTRLLAMARRWRELVELYERAVDLAESDVRAIAHLFRIGSIYEDHLDEPAQAAHTYRRVLERSPDHLGAIQALQRATERAGRYQELVEAIDLEVERITDHSQMVPLLHRAGEVLDTKMGDREAALIRFRRVLDMDPGYVPALVSLGRVYYALGRWEDLLEVYRQELDHTDKAARVPLLHKMAELCEVRIGRDEEALALYRQAVEVDPTHGPALRALARKLRERGDWPELVRTLELEMAGLRDTAAVARTAYKIGEVYEERLGQPDQAIRAYERAVQAVPQHGPSLDGLARLRTDRQSWAALVGELEQQAQGASDPAQAVEARLRQGVIFAESLGESRRALEAFEQILAQEPEHLGALLALEQLYRRVGAWEGLARVYETLARVLKDPGARVAALRELARVLELRGVGNPQHVRGAYEAILSIVPDDPGALDALERIALARGEREMLAAVDARIVSYTTDPIALGAHQTRLAESLEAIGDPAALDAYRRALEHDPESIGATRGLSRLAAQMDDPVALAEAARREASVAHDGEVAARLLVQSAAVRAERLGDHAGALTDLLRALELFPDDPEAAGRLTEALRARGEDARLCDVLGRAAASAQKPERIADLWMTVADLQAEKLDNVAAAIGSLNRVLRSAPNHVPTLRKLAELYARDGQWNEAVQLLGRVVQLAPDRDVLKQAHLRLASIWDERLGETPRALVSLQAVLALDPTNPSALARLSDLQERDGKIEEAADTAHRLVEASKRPSQRAPALVRLARLQQRRGNESAADAALLMAVTLEGPGSESALEYKARINTPDEWKAYVDALSRYQELGRVLHDQLGLVDQAVERLRTGIKLTGGSAQLRRELAMRLRAAGRFEDAVKVIRELLEMDLTLGDSWRDLSRTFDKMGRPVEARLCLDPLVVLGLATPRETETVGQGREPPPPRPGSFDEALLMSLGGYETNERAASELLVTLEAALAKLYPPDLDAFGLTTRDRITTRTGHPMRALADRIGAVVGVTDLELFFHRVRGRGVSVELSSPPSLLVPSAVADLPVAQQVFLLAPPIVHIAQHFHPVDKLTPRELEVLLASAARNVAEGFGAGLTSEEILDEQSRRLYKALPRRSRRSMEEAAARYVKASAVNFPRWVEKMRRASSRVALLLAGDLTSAIEALRRTERDLSGLDGMTLARRSELVADLLSFWMSEFAVQLRARAGLVPGRA